MSWWRTYSMFPAYSVEAQAPWVHSYALILLIPYQLSKWNNQSFPAWYGPGAVRCGSGVVRRRLVQLIVTRMSVNTTSAHRRPVFVDCHSRQLGIDRQCTQSLHRNDMSYCHFELCRDCGLGCFSELLLTYIRRLSVAAAVFLHQITVLYNKTQQHHFWNFILMTQCKLCTRAAAVAVNKERSPMGPM